MEPAVQPSTNDMSGEPDTRQPASAWLGVGVLASVASYIFLFGAQGKSSGYRIGLLSGTMLTGAMLVLPLFLAWRFGTKAGRRRPLSSAANAFCGAAAIVALLMLGLHKVMPYAIEWQARERLAAARNALPVDAATPLCLSVGTAGNTWRVVPPRCHPWERDWEGQEAELRNRLVLKMARECENVSDQFDAEHGKVPCVPKLEDRDKAAAKK